MRGDRLFAPRRARRVSVEPVRADLAVPVDQVAAVATQAAANAASGVPRLPDAFRRQSSMQHSWGEPSCAFAASDLFLTFAGAL